jgi:hypothetical protein
MIETALRQTEPRAIVSLDMPGRRWVVAIPLGDGRRITGSFPALPVAELEHAVGFYPRRVLGQMVRPWALRAIALHKQACAMREELALQG